MPVTYTSRKGFTYYLCRGVTKTGKPRYYFAREPKGEPVEQIPEGFKIGESVNGLVFLMKDRPEQILPEEVAAVEAAVRRHPKSRNYRVSVKHDRIRATMEDHARFTPVMRFILADEGQRTFRAERWCYRGSIDDWIDIRSTGTLDRQLVPKLGTEQFFELF